MGLEMYLKAAMYVGDWNHSPADEKNAYAAILEKLGLKNFRCDGAPSLTTSVNVAYWCKANAIHAWFVDHVQGGKDEYREAYVSRKQLEKLVKTCQEVLANAAIAKKLLPTRSGFFFGSTEYNEFYLNDLRDTVKQLRAVLDNECFKGWEFFYQSSW